MQEQVKVQEVPEVQIIERMQEQFVQVLERVEEQIGDTLVPPTVEERIQQRTVEQTVVAPARQVVAPFPDVHYVDVMSHESILENLETALKGDVFAMVYKVLLCRH